MSLSARLVFIVYFLRISLCGIEAQQCMCGVPCTQDAWNALLKARHDGMAPDDRTYNILIDACTACGELDYLDKVNVPNRCLPVAKRQLQLRLGKVRVNCSV